jgi:hypothetical protein
MHSSFKLNHIKEYLIDLLFSRLDNWHVRVGLLKFANIILFGSRYIHFHIHNCFRIQYHICMYFCKTDSDIYYIYFYGCPDLNITTSIFYLSNLNVKSYGLSTISFHP